MPKDTKSRKDAAGVSKKKKTTPKRRKKSSDDKKETSGSDSSSELQAVKTKKGEPPDHLRQRAEWFQKRHG